MCPECFPNLAVVIAGLTSTSWMTALVANFGTSINRTTRAQAASLETFRQAPSRDDMPKTRLETAHIGTCRPAATRQKITRNLSILGLLNRHTGKEQAQELSHPKPGS